VAALTQRLAARRDYELVQAWMAVFLRRHADAVLADAEHGALREALKTWHVAQVSEGRRLGQLVGYCAGVVDFLRAPR
jgi:U3 small nucleolar RNA-associated protein 21